VEPGQAPDIPTELTISFEGGIPVALDGLPVPPVELIERVHALGGRHGIGRIDHVEDRLVGIKSREIYETPAATILHTAHAALESLTLSKEQLRFNRFVADELAQATYDGIWFSALHRDLREYVHSAQRVVNGQVRLRLDHGTASVVGRRSDDSLYDRTLATYDADDAYDHAASVGFIRIFGLPLRTEAARHDSAWTWTQPMLGELPVSVADAEPAAPRPGRS
jgi:argininosuccinate synthase